MFLHMFMASNAVEMFQMQAPGNCGIDSFITLFVTIKAADGFTFLCGTFSIYRLMRMKSAYVRHQIRFKHFR